MTSGPFLPGYVLYVLEIMLPGIGVGELLGLWGGKSMGERLGMALGLGLGVDTVVMLVKTSGLQVGGLALRGLGPSVPYFLIVAGSAAFVVSLAWRRRASIIVKPTWTDAFLSLVIFVLGGILWLYFQKYPIFPQYYSQDFAVHVQIAEGLISGSSTSVPAGALYYGVHYQLASAFLLVGGEHLVTARVTMALLVLLSPLLVFWAASEIAEDRRAGLAVAALYSLSGTIWYSGVLDSGLYPNFFGILAVLLLIGCYARLSSDLRSARLWLVFLLATVTAYFSHYTAITVVPALFVFPLIEVVRRGKTSWKLFVPPLVFAAPGLAGAAADPALVSRLIYLALQGGGRLVAQTPLSKALADAPVLSYMAVLTYDDVAFVTMMVLAAVSVLWGRSKKGLYYVPLIWLVSLVLAAPISLDAWRFSYEGLVPFLIMAGFGFYLVLPKKGFERKRRGASKSVWLVLTSMVLLLLLVAGSWGTTVFSDSVGNPGQSSAVQAQVYDAIYWLGGHTPQNSTYLSVSDFRFIYSSLFIGRTTYYQFISEPLNATAEARTVGAEYVIVTKAVTENLPPVAQLFPWNNFPTSSSSNLTLLYNTTDVRIYQIA
jgi:hypothetical protein